MFAEERFRKVGLLVGTGKDDFTMERGSFTYRRKGGAVKRLKLLDFVRAENRTGGGCAAHADAFTLIFSLDGKAESCRLHIQKKAYACGVRYSLTLDAASLSPEMNRFTFILPKSPAEHFYGCGETHSEFDLRGQKVRIWVAEHQNLKRTAAKIRRLKTVGRVLGPQPQHKLPFRKYESYYAQPTFTSSLGYAVHVETSRFAEFDFTRPKELRLELEEAARITILAAGDFPALSEMLYNYLKTDALQPMDRDENPEGKTCPDRAVSNDELPADDRPAAPPQPRYLPDWIYDGAIVAIQGGVSAVEEKVKKAREAGARVCGVWSQDWCGCRKTAFGYQVMWNWHYDDELYPNLPEKIKEWKEDGLHFLGYINPFMAIEKEIYKEASAKGFTVKNKDGEDYLVTITTFPAAMIDLTNPAAVAWFKNLIKVNMIDAGLSGWMADFGEYLPVDAVLFSGEDAAALHNEWPARWARLNREAIEERGKQDEVFFFTRAGHTATVRYSDMMWTGDHHVDWSVDDGIGSVIPATLSLAMSGFPLAHSDAGGYTTNPPMHREKELLLRWEEMNVFSPLYRFHEGNRPWENVQFNADEDLLKNLAQTSLAHAALKPYLQALEHEAAERGIPVMRPLFYHYNEPRAYTETTEYLLGPDLLVAPVLQAGATSREVYFPKGEWVSFRDLNGAPAVEPAEPQVIIGPTVLEIEAPLGHCPAYIHKQPKLFSVK